MKNKLKYSRQATQKVTGRWRLAVALLAIMTLLGASDGDVIFKDSFENHAPEISSLPVTVTLIDTLYSYDVIATDIDGDLLLYGLVVSPDDMTIDELTGEIRWTPDQLGVFAVELLVDDGNGGTALQQWDINVQAVLDSDNDGLSDDEERAIGTDPHDPDSDDDGLKDGEEVNQYGTDPLDADTDNDGLSDGDEIKVHLTNPNNPDTDNDTYRDGEEIDYGSDPLDETDFPVNTIPADPADVAPEIDPTVETTVYGTTEFLYRGLNRVQTGVENGVIEPTQVAVIRGKVTSRDGAPLSGVLVTVLHHPEFGETISRADGMYDMAVNGGGYLTVNYARGGYLPAQRQVEAGWQSWVRAPDVALIPLDPVQTIIDLTQPGMQVARGSVVTDDRGSRQNTVLFPEGTLAEIVLPNGSTQPVSTITVSATEYSVGENGENAMPAQLPPGIGYTYCAELTVAEAANAGANQLKFSQPVPNYLENFMDFPAGAEVPAYYYDKNRGVWVTTPSGKVIDIVGINGGLADLDTDGDGLADDAPTLAALSITEAERNQLAGLYVTGDSLWRVQLEHFSTIDYNFPYPYPPSAYPRTPIPQPLHPEDHNCEESTASTIACQSQSLGEAVPIVGTPFSLHYTSSRNPGTISSRHLSIPVPGMICEETRVWVNVAGKQYLETLPCDGQDRVFQFTWDGLDAYGREVGSATVDVGMAYVHTALRYARWWNESAGEWAEAFVPVPPLLDVLVSERWKGQFINPDERRFGFGGWSVNAQHRYAFGPKLLSYGNGSKRSADAIGQIITKLFIYDRAKYYGMEAGPDGTVYLADYRNNRVTTFGPNGAFVGSFAGKYSSEIPPIFNGDGIPATEAYLYRPRDVAVGPDGSVYIADTGFARVRRVDRDGIIWTVAGNGVWDAPCDGCVATETPVAAVEKVAVGPDGTLYIIRGEEAPGYQVHYEVHKVGTDGIISSVYDPDPVPFSDKTYYPYLTDLVVGPENSLYVSQYTCWGACSVEGNHAVVRVWPSGEVEVIAGNGTNGFSGDGGPAIDAQLEQPNGVALGNDQSVYISDLGNRRIRKVSPDGIISTVAGCDSASPDCLYTSVYGLFSTMTSLSPGAISYGPDGLYIISNGFERLLRMDPPLPGLTEGEIMLPDESGKQVYFFEANGRHLRTVNSLTGTVTYRFDYSGDGLLTQIRDGDGNVTTFERDTAGNPTAIIGPYGQRTELGLDANGYLASITNPAGEAWQFGYTPDGLLTSSTNPNTHTSTYDYDSLGRLVQTQDAAGGGHTLVRAELEDGYEVSRTTELGRTTAYKIQNLPTGDLQRMNTFPGGVESIGIAGTNGVNTSMGPEGTTLVAQLGPDSRFGMQSPFPASLAIQTPGGITHETSRSHATTLENTYNVLSLLTQTENLEVNGQTYTTVFDATSRLFTDTTPEGRQIFTNLDAQGRVTERVIPGMEPVVFEYDTKGRLIRITRGSGLHARDYLFTYGSNGYLTEIEDPLSRTFSLSYDQAGKLISYTLPDSRTVHYGYDNLGNTTSIQPPGRSAHQFEYSPVNLQLAYLPPDLGTGDPRTNYEYTKDRHLAQADRPDGKTVSFSYDDAGHLSSVVIPRGTYGYTYIPMTGQLSSITAPDGGTLSLSYDAALITEATWAGVVAGTVSRTYGPGFQVISRSVNGDHQVDMTYDNDRLLIQAGNLSLTRDSGTGRAVGSALENVVDTRTFNGFGEIESYSAEYSGNPLMEIQYTRDKLGRITQQTEAIEGTLHVYDYVYDLAGRLVQVSMDSVVVSTYTYDANNNRLSFERQGGSYAGTYDDQDRLLEYGDASFSYTLNGELNSKSIGVQTTNYTFDAIGNLVTVIDPEGDQVEYILDGVNRRIGKRVNGTLVQGFLYKDRVNPIVELDAAGVVRSRFVYASSVHVPDYMVRDGTTYRILSDHLGSPRLVVDVSTGAIAQQITYDEFGNVLADTNPGFQPFGFAGGLYDPDTGLTRFGIRDYDPETGRWLAKDPSRFRNAGTNLYEYVKSDPMNRIDPLGSTSQSASSADQQLSSIPDLSWESLGQWASDTAQNIAESQVVGAVAEALDMVGEIEFASQMGGYIDTIQGVIDDIFGVLDDVLAVEEIANDPRLSEAEQGAGILSCLRDRFTSLVGYTGGASGLYHENVVDMAIGTMEFGIEYNGMIRTGHADRANAAYAEGEN